MSLDPLFFLLFFGGGFLFPFLFVLFVSCAVVVVFATRVVAEGCVLQELQAVVRHHASCSFITTLILRPAILPWRYVFAKFSLSLSLFLFLSFFPLFYPFLWGWEFGFVSTVKMERRRFSSFFGSTKKKG